MKPTDQLWVELASPHFVDCSNQELLRLRMDAAANWLYEKQDSLLYRLYDQYVMLRTLKGIEHGN